MFTLSLTVSTNSLLFEILADRCSSHCYLWGPTAQHTWPNRFIHPFTHTHTQSSLSPWNGILWFFKLEFLLSSPSQIPTERLKVVSGPILFQICPIYIYICSRTVSDDDESICPFAFQFYSNGHPLNSLPTPKCQRQNNRMGNALLWKKNGKQWQLLWAGVLIHLKEESFIQFQQIAVKVGI